MKDIYTQINELDQSEIDKEQIMSAYNKLRALDAFYNSKLDNDFLMGKIPNFWMNQESWRCRNRIENIYAKRETPYRRPQTLINMRKLILSMEMNRGCRHEEIANFAGLKVFTLINYLRHFDYFRKDFEEAGRIGA